MSSRRDFSTTSRSTPGLVGTDTNWSDASAGGTHTVALRTDGTLWAWGTNTYGQVGDGTTTTRFAPVQVGTATTWKLARAGGGHTLALRTDGTLWSWGLNLKGQLGDGTTTNRSSPAQVGTGTWSTVSAGWLSSAGTR